MLKGKMPTKNTLLITVVLQNWRKDKDFLKQKLKESITTKPVLKDWLKGVLQVEMKGH